MSLATPKVAAVEEPACEELEEVILGNDPEKFFEVGVQYPPQEKEELVMFLKKNVDLFAWNAYEASEVDPSFICHHLNVNPAVVPRKQPPRRSSKEHSEAVKEEVVKLKKADAIKEVFYPKLLAYIVVMKKKNGKWTVYTRSTDYTGRIAKWGTILRAFDIKYMPRTSMKGQVLADLVVEFAEPSLEENAKKLDVDEKSVGVTFEKSLRLRFSATNNEAEYEALLVGMAMVQKMGGKTAQGLDIVRPFPKAVGNRRWLLVGTDYFTKWVEAEPLSNIRDLDVKKFFWKNIITRFGIPYTLISDNDLQFDNKAFRRYYCDLGITNRYSTPTYPQENGQVEAVNKVIVIGLKKRLDDTKGRWVEELPHVLWTYRITPRRSTRETTYSMTYGAEAVIRLETRFPTLRTSSFIPSSNENLLEKSLDLVEERGENAMV
ncbi:uncharacterized protein LOC142606254 [Castanea sativa]|uniref:uncharacterized protein LOC142606254 n=1 Tax=Castanea sativa TaxID=21020 RepID=UPI003F64E3FE